MNLALWLAIEFIFGENEHKLWSIANVLHLFRFKRFMSSIE